jgi:polar amino acid transport system substrate-binding protein
MMGHRIALAAAMLGMILAQPSAHGEETTPASPYIVGATASGAPFSFFDAKTDTITGAMVDIVRAIAAEAGFAVEVRQTPWSTLIPSLTEGKIDLIAAALSVTPEREKLIAFSDPVYSYGEALLLPGDDRQTVHSWRELAGKAVGVPVASRYAEVLKSSGIFRELRLYDGLPELVRDVAQRRLDAGIAAYPLLALSLVSPAPGDAPASRTAAKAVDPSTRLHLVRSVTPEIMTQLAIGLRKDQQPLRDRINAALQKLKSDGRLEAILRKWHIA